MLLLVLIFVLAAFALLLLALVTGTAAWAWISVVVSVVAAGILVYDWAQRRAAVRTGAGDRPVPQYQPMVPVRHEEPPTTAIPAVGHLPEPATEVFPALNQQQGAGSWPSGSAYGQPPSGPITGGPVPVGASAPGATSGPASDQTPPSSAERPSGAESESGKEAEFSSQSVTAGKSEAAPKAEDDAATADSDSTEHKGYSDAGKAAAAGATGLAAAGAASAASSWFGGNRDSESKSGADEKAGAAAASTGSPGKDDYSRWQPQGGQAPQASVAAEPAAPEQPASAPPAASAPAGGDTKADAGDKPATTQGGGTPGYGSPAYSAAPGSFAGWPAGSPESAGSSASPTPPAEGKTDDRGTAPAKDSDVTERRAADAKTGSGENAAAAPAAAASSAAAAASSAAAPSSTPPTTPPATGADPTTALPVMGGAQRGTAQGGSSVQRADATQAINPVKGPAAEPGEETPDSAALATVSKLGDEVLVVDEHPRFHLAGCQTLAGNDTIPLPVKEALEYGFSPCATCSPVRVLAGRNRAASSS